MSTKQAECQLSATGLHEGIALAPYAHIMRPAGRTDGTEASDGKAGRPARGAEAGRDDAGHTEVGRAGASRAGVGRVGAGHAGAAHERTDRAGTGGATVGRNASGTGAGRAGAGRDQAARDQADGAAATFRSAIAEVESGLALVRGLRPELTFEQEPAPRKLAPYAASVTVTVCEADGDVGWGRFVLLYDPVGQRGWGGPFRIIGHIRVDLEPEIAADPLVGEVGWSWLIEALDASAVGYQHSSGTVTRVVTEGFGAKQDEPVMTEFELRASWSPAWQQPDGSAVTGSKPTHAQVDPVRNGPARQGTARQGTARQGTAPAAPGPADSSPTDSSSAAPGPAAPGPAAPGPAAPGPADGGPADGGPADGGQPSGLGLDGHVAAWCEALCAAAGLPPLAAGVSALRQPRGRRPR